MTTTRVANENFMKSIDDSTLPDEAGRFGFQIEATANVVALMRFKEAVHSCRAPIGLRPCVAVDMLAVNCRIA